MIDLTCREMLDFLSDYLDGSLPRETASAFEEHLKVCPDCVAYLDNFRATLQATKAAYQSAPADAALPENLVQAILSSRTKHS